MCGFTGFLSQSSQARRSDLRALGRAMADAIKHRGPDDSDIWQDETISLVFAFRRLAIIDLSAEGRQPMRSSSGRYTIVFNGEIYNFMALRAELERAGAKFRGRSDTEVILAGAEIWGLNQTLQKINGMFAMAIYDATERVLHFARDRLGKKPLYVGWAGKTLVFGSELKALRAHPDFEASIDQEGLSLYLTYDYIPSPASIYKNVWSLPAGYRLSLKADIEPGTNLKFKMESYWHHTRVLEDARTKMIEGPDDKITDEFEELLKTCVKDRMVSDVPLGAFLSGGIDSSSIVALMQSVSAQPVKTYTIGFNEPGYNEAEFAKKIAAHLGTDHHEIYLSAQDAMGIIPALPDMYDEPFADMSAIPTYLVSKFARDDVTVALSGDGGDEMLGGYNRHVEGAALWKRMKFIPRPLRKSMARAITNVSTEKWDALARSRPQFGVLMHKTAGFLSQDTQENMYQSLLSTWPEPPMKNKTKAATMLTDADHAPPSSLSFAEKMMYWDALFYLPGDILTKVDRASMATSLEARAPLLDRRIYEYAWRLPEKFKIRGGKGKWLLRQVLSRHVPREYFERHKQGFAVPAGAWLRGPLRDWAEDLISERNLTAQNVFDVQTVRETWAQHLAGNGYTAQKMWNILMFQAWHKRWMEGR
jgi:asparagine synthase (glutamine-hydrolysing)